jgi:hypothetical protein
MVLWILLLAVLVGGGGEAKIALGRRYQSPFRKTTLATAAIYHCKKGNSKASRSKAALTTV